MFIRRIYYDTNTGEILESYMMQGAVIHLPQSSDFITQPRLQGRSLNDTNVIEWLEPDPVIEDDFSRAASFKVVDEQLLFDFTPLPPTESEDMLNALTLLGVEPVEV